MSITHRRSPVSDRSTARPRVGRRVARRVLEGRHEWGDLDVWPSRYGYTTFCLVVDPPGATRSERIRFRMMRAWPPLGLLLGVLTLIAAAQVVSPVLAGVAAAVVYGGGAAGSALLAGPGRHRIRTLRTCREERWTGTSDSSAQALLDELSAVLLQAEQGLRSGRLDAVAFELVHGEVWDRLGPARVRHG